MLDINFISNNSNQAGFLIFKNIIIPFISGFLGTGLVFFLGWKKLQSEERRWLNEIQISLDKMNSEEVRWEREHYKKREVEDIFEYFDCLLNYDRTLIASSCYIELNNEWDESRDKLILENIIAKRIDIQVSFRKIQYYVRILQENQYQQFFTLMDDIISYETSLKDIIHQMYSQSIKVYPDLLVHQSIEHREKLSISFMAVLELLAIWINPPIFNDQKDMNESIL